MRKKKNKMLIIAEFLAQRHGGHRGSQRGWGYLRKGGGSNSDGEKTTKLD